MPPPEVTPTHKSDEAQVDRIHATETGARKAKPGKKPRVENGRVVMDPVLVELIDHWPLASRQAVTIMHAKYGVPTEISDEQVVWRRAGRWKAIIVHRDGVKHHFPIPHQDVLEQVISYDVPADKFDDLAAFSGSLVARRTDGTLAATCDREPSNILLLNLAHDIVRDRKTVSEARTILAKVALDAKDGKPSPLSRKLVFGPRGATGDPDQPKK